MVCVVVSSKNMLQPKEDNRDGRGGGGGFVIQFLSVIQRLEALSAN